MKSILRRLFKKSPQEFTPELSPLTVEAIQSAESDEALQILLSTELARVIPSDFGSYDDLARHIQTLPVGLRAMAAVHRLDISLTLESLKEHFANFPGFLYAEETLKGLHELGLDDFAELFETALTAVRPVGLYEHSRLLSSELTSQLDALSSQMWDLKDRNGIDSLMDCWAPYARKYPERVLMSN